MSAHFIVYYGTDRFNVAHAMQLTQNFMHDLCIEVLRWDFITCFITWLKYFSDLNPLVILKYSWHFDFIPIPWL